MDWYITLSSITHTDNIVSYRIHVLSYMCCNNTGKLTLEVISSNICFFIIPRNSKYSSARNASCSSPSLVASLLPLCLFNAVFENVKGRECYSSSDQWDSIVGQNCSAAIAVHRSRRSSYSLCRIVHLGCIVCVVDH